jgi:hypothetical protein
MGEDVLTGHKSQAALPFIFLYEFIGHAVHVVPFSPVYPLSHMHAVIFELPDRDDECIAQFMTLPSEHHVPATQISLVFDEFPRSVLEFEEVPMTQCPDIKRMSVIHHIHLVFIFVSQTRCA